MGRAYFALDSRMLLTVRTGCPDFSVMRRRLPVHGRAAMNSRRRIRDLPADRGGAYREAGCKGTGSLSGVAVRVLLSEPGFLLRGEKGAGEFSAWR
jgi:hypothetical protein